MSDYAAVCLALFITGAAWWIITEYLTDALYDEHLSHMGYGIIGAYNITYDEIVRIFQ